MEIRLLRYVVAVAEELHFSRAALRERIAQPSLSKQIHDLELRLGTPLFLRTHRDVSLTDAGHAFIKEARKALFYSERAVNSVAELKQPQGDSLTLGYSPQTNLRLLTIVRGMCEAQTPRLRIDLISSYTPDQLHSLSQGAIQVGLVTLPLKHDLIATKFLIREPLVIAVPEHHRLGRKTHMKARELNGTPVISFPRHVNPIFHDHLNILFKKEGYAPNVVQEVSTQAEALYMVAEGRGVTFVTSAIPNDGKGIVYRRFCEPGLVQETGIAYRRRNISPNIQSFVTALRRTVQQTPGGSLSGAGPGFEADPRQLHLF